MEEYDIAQICLNGHCTNDSYKSLPQFNKNYCDNCGEKTITLCPNCNSSIRGAYQQQNSFTDYPFLVPNYCCECGEPFPWLTSKLDAAIELVRLEEALDEEETSKFKEYILDISKDTPSSKVSAIQLGKMLKRFSKTVAGEIRAVSIEIASEAIKKILTDPSTF